MTQSDTLTLISIIVTGVGSIAAVIGLVSVYVQVRASQRIAKGDFLLHLDELLRTHDKAYRATMKLDWEPDKYEVSYADMENYMTLFEQFKVLMDLGIIDLEIFDRLYAYRVMMIVLTDSIYNNALTKYQEGWPDFIALCKRLEVRRRVRMAERTDEWGVRWHKYVERVGPMVVSE